ncbi:MAG: pyrroline-5-carboxylate reductase [Hyphomicrobium sp.]
MTIDLEGPLVLAGAGKMGEALLKGLLARGLAASSVVIQEPAPSPSMRTLAAEAGLRLLPAIDALGEPPAVLLVAVKPQVMDRVFPPLARLADPKTLTVSIAAGRSLASFTAHLPAGSAVVRAMPNTPAAIGRGITVCCPNAFVSAEQRQLAGSLLAAVGEVDWIDDEAQMDAVTAVSGSGPAYVFLLAECLAEAGMRMGLDEGLARRIARATVSGSGELLNVSSEAASTLRQNVTSPGGTTAAALGVLMADDGLQPLLTRAVDAATRRGRELARS